MLGKSLLLLALPIAGLHAQSTPIRVVVRSHDGGEFRLVRTTPDSAQAPIFGRGVLELAAADAQDAVEIAAMDTMNNVHVEATQGGRVIASGDGRYLTVRRDQNGIAIEARSERVAPVSRERRRP